MEFKKGVRKGQKVIEEPEYDYEEHVSIDIKRKKRHRGVESFSVDKTETSATEQVEGIMKRSFVKPSDTLEQLRAKHMEEYIADKLKKQKTEEKSDQIFFHEPKSPSKHEFLPSIPAELQASSKRIESGSEKTHWHTGLLEVPLSLKHKLDNIEATEAAKRRVLKEVSVPESRFKELHEEEYETFHSNNAQAKQDRKLEESLIKQFSLRGKALKKEKDQRRRMNEMIERSWL